eukprot:Gb_12392 [translate_table: standard]
MIRYKEKKQKCKAECIEKKMHVEEASTCVEPSSNQVPLTLKGKVKCANGKEEEAFKEDLGLLRDKGRNEKPKAKKALGHTFSYLNKSNVKEVAFVLHLPYAIS